MTEAEWLACTDPQKMLGFLRGEVSDPDSNWEEGRSCPSR
jgi:hypothetical protein